MQPDTIIPSPSNPQDWNRYVYVRNTPIRYSDPTGHKSCYNLGLSGGCEDSNEETKLNSLFDYIDRSILNKKGTRIRGGLSSLQAMEKIVTRAAHNYGDDWDGFLNATSLIFMGVYRHGASAMLAARLSGETGMIDGDSGFNSDFRDYTSPQVRHFWAGFATAADPTGDNPSGEFWAYMGNDFHEITQDTRAAKDGASVMDYALTLTAIDIAKQVGNEIKTPLDLVEVLHYRLGEDGPGYMGPPIPTEWWWTPYD